MGAVGLHFGHGPGADLLSGLVAIHAEAAGAGARNTAATSLGEPLLQRGVIKADQPLLRALGSPLGRRRCLEAQQILQRLNPAADLIGVHPQDCRQLPIPHRLPLGAQQRQQRLHGAVVAWSREATLEGVLIEAIHAGRQGIEALAVLELEGTAGDVVEHPHGMEKLAAAFGLQHRGGVAAAEAGAAEDRGQGLLLAAGLHVVVNVRQVFCFLGVDLFDREKPLAQRLHHLRPAAARGQNPQPGGQIAGFPRQQIHDRVAAGAAAAGAVVEGFIEGIQHQQAPGGRGRDGGQRCHQRLLEGPQRFSLRLVEALTQAGGAIGLQGLAVGGQFLLKLGRQALHEATGGEVGVLLPAAEVLGQQR